MKLQMFAKEQILNKYYNIGGYNKPEKIGYMMKMIRQLKPITETEWKMWYLSNKLSEEKIHKIVVDFFESIPEYIAKNNNIDESECERYVYDVMFRRTFNGYNKEKFALEELKRVISPEVKESNETWDTKYFIDFYVKTKTGMIIGIQLKPETFYLGHYDNVVDIENKMKNFCKEFNAVTYILRYKKTSDKKIEFVNEEIIEEIKRLL